MYNYYTLIFLAIVSFRGYLFYFFPKKIRPVFPRRSYATADLYTKY